jgi:hypothetical protein
MADPIGEFVGCQQFRRLWPKIAIFQSIEKPLLERVAELVGACVPVKQPLAANPSTFVVASSISCNADALNRGYACAHIASQLATDWNICGTENLWVELRHNTKVFPSSNRIFHDFLQTDHCYCKVVHPAGNHLFPV